MNPTWIWGRHPVLEALRAGTAVRVLIARGLEPSAVVAEIRRQAQQRSIPIADVTRAEIELLASGKRTQGVAAEALQPKIRDIEDLLDRKEVTAAYFLVLDQIQDPHNVGALLRTANAAGVQALVLPDRRSAPLSGVVAKVSAGAQSHTPCIQVSNLARVMDRFRDSGIWTVGLDSEARTSIYEIDLTIPVALVVGGEWGGLRRLTRSRCDFLVRLPMLGAVESLNASVAGAIAMYEVVRQRLGQPGSNRIEVE